MSTRRLSILLGVIVLIAAGLACSSTPDATATPAPTATPTGPTAANFYMSSDAEGKVQTTEFTNQQTVYVNLDVTNFLPDTKLQADWYALDVSGQDSTKPFHTVKYNGSDLKLDPGTTSIYLSLSAPNNGWPAGHYRVDVLVDGTKAGEQTFSIK
jgi:hypothetical protein